MEKIKTWLNKPTQPYGLALFRILFGLIMLWDLNRINEIDLIESIYDRGLIFRYEFLELPLIEYETMKGLFLLLMVCAVLITVGVFYRYAMIIFALGYSYFFFLDPTLYNNHLYLVCLFSFMMTFMPADAAFSLSKKRHSDTIPQWSYRLLQVQIVIVFFFGAISKINPYWFDLHPGTEILQSAAVRTGVSFLKSDFVLYFIVWMGFIFDLVVGVFIWIPKTRKWAIYATIGFNLTNTWLFNDIFIFPFMMISAMLLFVDQAKLAEFLLKRKMIKAKRETPRQYKGLGVAGVAVIGLYLIIQLWLPIRHYFIPGYTDWTGEGQRFSWRMKIQHRQVNDNTFQIFDVTNKVIYPVTLNKYLYPDEITQMCNSPQMIIQFAEYLAEQTKKNLRTKEVWVKARINVEFNGRSAVDIFDPDVDLISESKKHESINDWINPIPETTALEKPYQDTVTVQGQ